LRFLGDGFSRESCGRRILEREALGDEGLGIIFLSRMMEWGFLW
jgi:hypothetical protein